MQIKKHGLRKRSIRSRRRLRVESLEARRLLAADTCELSAHGVETPPVTEGQSQISQMYNATDAAGETLATAADLGLVEGQFQGDGQLSLFDQVDLVHFEVGSRSEVSVGIDQLTRDADLHVLNRDGEIIASSTKSGRSSEGLAGTLSSGDYYIAITANSWRTTRYRLTLDVSPFTASPTPPVTDSPILPPATGAPGAEPPSTPTPTPAVVQPLADVAYFGASRDWNLNAVSAPEAWAAGYTGQGITVAVVDTGVDLDHPDLVSNLYVNPGEIAGNGIDDDGNGFIDDVSGYDFVSNDSRADDGNGHGTHVAGTIAAANDGRGATGVAHGATILPVRVLGNNGSGSDWDVADGIRYAANLGAHIINVSLGGGYSSRIADAIEYAASLGSLIVAAAGNESASAPSYPARYSSQSSSVISVGAYDSQENVAGFSNRVGSSGSIQVDAPGVGIYSTYTGGRYGTLSGTSMAAPHVAGVAALTLSANPSLTSRELRELLASYTEGSINGSDAIGKISAAYTVAYAAAGFNGASPAVDTRLVSGNGRAGVRATTNPEIRVASALLDRDFSINQSDEPDSERLTLITEPAAPLTVHAADSNVSNDDDALFIFEVQDDDETSLALKQPFSYVISVGSFIAANTFSSVI